MNKKYTLEYVKEYIESFDYKLLSTEYINCISKLILQCPEKHEFEMDLLHFQRGQRCIKCSGNEKHTFINVKNYIESFNYKVLSTEYKNAHQKLKLQCPKEHIIYLPFHSFKRGNRCIECSGLKKYTLEEVKNYIESFNYKLLSTEYKNAFQKLELQCDKGHTYDTIYNTFQQGHRCPYCAEIKGWSKPEKEIVEFVKQNYYGKIIENDRTQIKNFWSGMPLELDIWLPETKRAIEYNGSYWHLNEYSKWKDEMKRKQCMKKQIDLLVINDKNWLNDKLCCLNNISDFIGI